MLIHNCRMADEQISNQRRRIEALATEINKLHKALKYLRWDLGRRDDFGEMFETALCTIDVVLGDATREECEDSLPDFLQPPEL